MAKQLENSEQHYQPRSPWIQRIETPEPSTGGLTGTKTHKNTALITRSHRTFLMSAVVILTEISDHKRPKKMPGSQPIRKACSFPHSVSQTGASFFSKIGVLGRGHRRFKRWRLGMVLHAIEAALSEAGSRTWISSSVLPA